MSGPLVKIVNRIARIELPKEFTARGFEVEGDCEIVWSTPSPQGPKTGRVRLGTTRPNLLLALDGQVEIPIWARVILRTVAIPTVWEIRVAPVPGGVQVHCQIEKPKPWKYDHLVPVGDADQLYFENMNDIVQMIFFGKVKEEK